MKRCCLLLFSALALLAGEAQKKSSFSPAVSAPLARKLAVIHDDQVLTVSVSLPVADEALTKQFRLQPIVTTIHVYKGRLTKKELLQLVTIAGNVFINEYHPPKEELNTGAVDYTLNKIRLAQARYPLVHGDSIFLSVKERAFDTADIDFKGRVFLSGVAAAQQTSHASLMTTIIAGGGNSSPEAKGVAPKALLSSADFSNLFPETDDFYGQKKISVQNHSYGTVVENIYGNEAVAYDRSAANNPLLVHVFSAGNAGSAAPASGVYANLAGVANLTGNFKQSKNSFSVAALDSSGRPMAAASKGPAYDGRLKPELAAYGEDGSSGAAALVSGTVALVQQAFRQLTGQLPTSQMVKAILLNTADDVGAAGIDFATGFGSLNAFHAISAVQQNHFFQSSVVAGETRIFSLPVSTGVAKLKVTLAWNDPAAPPNAAKALVNDLDLVLRNRTTGEVWQPWVLNHFPHPDSLRQLSTRRRDTLNTVEQVTLDLPAAGNYQVEVRGAHVSTASQSFALCWQADTVASFRWVHPLNGDAIAANGTSLLRWQTSMTGTAGLEVSFDKTNWSIVSSSVDLSQRQLRWVAPDTTALIFFRMNIGGNYVVADSVVLAAPLHLHVGFVCADSFQLNWRRLPAAGYRLYRLGDKYMETFRLVTDTTVVLPVSQLSSRHFAVAPVVQNKEGKRSNSVPAEATSAGCYFLAFYLRAQTGRAALFTAELGTLYGVKEISLEKRGANGFAAIQTMATPQHTVFDVSDPALIKGENTYRLKLILQNGVVLYSTIERVFYAGDLPVYVYPNPVSQSETIRIIATEPGRFTLRILNSNGVEVFRQLITASSTPLAANRFSKGFYFVRIDDRDGQSFTQKLVIQ